MSLFASTGFNLLAAFTDDGQKLTRAQKIHRENERSNLMTISRLVLRSFLENAMTANNRIVEGDTQQLSDLFMMLEKVLWHGFKNNGHKSIVMIKTPDQELWSALQRMSKNDEAMLEAWTCIEQLDELLTPISRIRGFLRLATMQKKLADFFANIAACPFLREFYESWALLRQEDVVQLTGALLGLSVVDCNLALIHDHLQDQPLSVDLALYIRIPTVAVDAEIGDIISQNEVANENERRMLLDQNNYLEERNRLLQSKLDEVRRKVDAEETKRNDNTSVSIEQEMVSFHNNLPSLAAEMDTSAAWEAERNQLLAQVVEHEDSLKIAQQQVSDTMKVKAELYEKLRQSEEAVRRLEKEIVKYRDHQAQEKEVLRRSVTQLEEQNGLLVEKVRNRESSDDAARLELDKKCEQYTSSCARLEEKQKELAMTNEELLVLRRQMTSMEADVLNVASLKEEVSDLREKLEESVSRAEEAEQALEDMALEFGDSKLRVVELKEELLPLTDAQWAEDSKVHNCSDCDSKFTISNRKHHCRMCGSIFCGSCSEGRVKLPSKKKPARVCDRCFVVLQNRNQKQ